MLTYRQINDEPDHARDIWEREQACPGWFTAASELWTPTWEKFFEWYQRVPEIWGLFDDEKLVACVYLEYPAVSEVNIHLSLLARIDQGELIRFLDALSRQKLTEGVKLRRGWVLARNKGLMRIAERCGFTATGAKMDFGHHRGRLLRWLEVQG